LASLTAAILKNFLLAETEIIPFTDSSSLGKDYSNTFIYLFATTNRGNSYKNWDAFKVSLKNSPLLYILEPLSQRISSSFFTWGSSKVSYVDKKAKKLRLLSIKEGDPENRAPIFRNIFTLLGELICGLGLVCILCAIISAFSYFDASSISIIPSATRVLRLQQSWG
jgi:hypothetical protein